MSFYPTVVSTFAKVVLCDDGHVKKSQLAEQCCRQACISHNAVLSCMLVTLDCSLFFRMRLHLMLHFLRLQYIQALLLTCTVSKVHAFESAEEPHSIRRLGFRILRSIPSLRFEARSSAILQHELRHIRPHLSRIQTFFDFNQFKYYQ